VRGASRKSLPVARMVSRRNPDRVENLRMGAYLRSDKAGIAKDLEVHFSDLFLSPRLKEL